MSNDLESVYNELEIGLRGQNNLKRAGIHTFEDLTSKRTQLEKQTLEGVTVTLQKILFSVVRWADSFERENGRKPDICSDFTERGHDLFLRKEERQKTSSAAAA